MSLIAKTSSQLQTGAVASVLADTLNAGAGYAKRGFIVLPNPIDRAGDYLVNIDSSAFNTSGSLIKGLHVMLGVYYPDTQLDGILNARITDVGPGISDYFGISMWSHTHQLDVIARETLTQNLAANMLKVNANANIFMPEKARVVLGVELLDGADAPLTAAIPPGDNLYTWEVPLQIVVRILHLRDP